MEAGVLVIGAGALGSLIAARLGASGTPVAVAVRSEMTARPLRANGVEATDLDGASVRAHPPVLIAPAQPPWPVSLVVLATKCHDATPALDAWLGRVGPRVPVVGIQNGVMGDTLAARLGDRLVECAVAFPATLESPGRSRQTGPGPMILGPWPEAYPHHDPSMYRGVAETLAAAGPVRACPNMRGSKWTKLLINSCVTTMGAVTGQDLGAMLDDARARRIFVHVVREGYRAGRAKGVRFEEVAGLRPWMFARDYPGQDFIMRAIGWKYRRQRSSSLQSLERGGRTEVDYLNGHIVAAAREAGLDAPVNASLVSLVHQIEEGRRNPSPANLRDIPL